MKIKRVLTTTCLVLLVVCSLVYAESKGYLDGQEEARKDIKSGESKYMLYGQPQAHDQLLSEILKKEYKITLVVVGGCTVAEAARDRADGYNKVILDYLREKSKKDIIKEAEDKARKQWEREHAKAEPDASANGASPRR